MNRAWTVAPVALVLSLAGCATAPPAEPVDAPSKTRVISPGPAYSGDRPVSRLYVYFLIDLRPESMTDTFREVAGEKLAAALNSSGIASKQLWASETPYGRAFQADLKNRTHFSLTIAKADPLILGNRSREQAFAPSHRLVVFPHETLKSDEGGTVNVKWDVIDALNGNYEWSVYTQTTAMTYMASRAQAEVAATRFVDAIVQELRARKVVPAAKGP